MDAAESTELPATAVEVEHARPAAGFVQGILVGIAASAVLIHLGLAFALAKFAQMYRDFAFFVLPRLVTSPVWLWAIPAIGAGALALLVGKRPRGVAPYLITTVVLLSTVAATWYFGDAPLWMDIQAG